VQQTRRRATPAEAVAAAARTLDRPTLARLLDLASVTHPGTTPTAEDIEDLLAARYTNPREARRHLYKALRSTRQAAQALFAADTGHPAQALALLAHAAVAAPSR